VNRDRSGQDEHDGDGEEKTGTLQHGKKNSERHLNGR
jgi:hypothetical protein